MLKEMRGMEYTLEVLRALHHNPGEHDSKAIAEMMERGGRVKISVSYVQKILPRMVRVDLLQSSDHGYQLVDPVDEITVDRVLDICDMPEEDSPLYSLCCELKKGVSLSTIDEFYDFSE
jgi:DNA-binding IscR family transcriptional regulator